jgi:endonuclease/exonuclease/phosphatase family metal-dependent hydrolase
MVSVGGTVLCVLVAWSHLWAGGRSLVPIIASVALPLVLVVALGLSVLHLRRHPVVGILLLVLVVTPVARVADEFVADDARGPAAGEHLRVAALNTLNGRAHLDEVLELAADSDVLMLSEVPPNYVQEVDERLREPMELTYQVRDRRMGGGIAVWTRSTLDLGRVEGGPLSSLGARAGRLGFSGSPVSVIAAHFYNPVFHSRHDWNQQFDLVAEHVRANAAAGRPTIVVGDLNSTPWHARLRDWAADTGLRTCTDQLGVGLSATWTPWTPGPALLGLDHVLTSQEVQCLEWETRAVTGSDHKAILSILALPG